MKNFLQAGERLQYANSSGSTITSGSPVLVGKRIGIAVADIADGTTGILAMDGVFSITKLTADVVTQGALLYWDDTNKRLTITPSTHELAGYAHAAADGTKTTVECRINR